MEVNDIVFKFVEQLGLFKSHAGSWQDILILN